MKIGKHAVFLFLLTLSLIITACSRTPGPGIQGEVEEKTTGKVEALDKERSTERETDSENLKPVIYTSFYPIYDLTRQIVGADMTVESFMDTDKDPHLWEPTPRDLQKLLEADLFIVNGANMERWLPSLRESLPELEILTLSDSVELITYTGAAAIGDFQYMAGYDYETDTDYGIDFGHTHEDIMRIAFIKDDDAMSLEEAIAAGKKAMEQKAKVFKQYSTIEVESDVCYALEMGHEKGRIHFRLPESGKWYFYSDRLSENILPYVLIDADGAMLPVDTLQEGSISGMDGISYDPHSWLSLSNTKRYANAIHDELVRRYPELERGLRRRKVKLIDTMTSLEFEYSSKFKDLEFREFVVTHHAYAYLARDFDLRQYALQGLISTDSPSLKTIRKALEFCQHYKIDTIFYEYGREKKGADTLALELRGEVLPLASLEYITPEQRRENTGYVDLMRMNLENLYTALARANQIQMEE